MSPPRLPIPTHRLIPGDCSIKFGGLQCNFILYVGLPAYFARFRIAAAIEGQTPAYYAYELRIARLHRIAASHKLTQELRITIVPYGGYHSAYASLYAGRTHAISLSYRRVHLGSYVIQMMYIMDTPVLSFIARQPKPAKPMLRSLIIITTIIGVQVDTVIIAEILFMYRHKQTGIRKVLPSM